MLLCAESLATPENRPYSLPSSALPQVCPIGKTAHLCPWFLLFPGSQLQGQPFSSLSCLHFFRVMDKSPTSSKMRAMTPMELETAVAAVPKLREANKTTRMLQLPWLAAVTIRKIALGPPRFCGRSLTSGFHIPNSQPSPAPILSLSPLPQPPWPWSHPHQSTNGAKQTVFQDA